MTNKTEDQKQAPKHVLKKLLQYRPHRSENKEYEVILYYKYTKLDSPEKFRDLHYIKCMELNLTGRVLLAKEGINGTLEGDKESTQAYIDWLRSFDEFKNVTFKRSFGNGNEFPRLRITVRDEVVSLGLGSAGDIDPNKITGKHLESEELHKWFREGKEFYVVDMRNDYETKIGHFKNSIILDGFKNFRDLPKIAHQIEDLKDKTVVTVCTGGIRCEKASGYLVSLGFKDVYQLKDGIHTYMQKYPNEDFLGKLYVFDERMKIAFKPEDPNHVVVGRCCGCGVECEDIYDIFRNGERTQDIVCPKCKEEGKVELDSAQFKKKALAN